MITTTVLTASDDWVMDALQAYPAGAVGPIAIIILIALAAVAAIAIGVFALLDRALTACIISFSVAGVLIGVVGVIFTPMVNKATKNSGLVAMQSDAVALVEEAVTIDLVKRYEVSSVALGVSTFPPDKFDDGFNAREARELLRATLNDPYPVTLLLDDGRALHWSIMPAELQSIDQGFTLISPDPSISPLDIERQPR